MGRLVAAAGSLATSEFCMEAMKGLKVVQSDLDFHIWIISGMTSPERLFILRNALVLLRKSEILNCMRRV